MNWVIGMLTIFSVSVIIGNAVGLRINLSSSAPRGLWATEPIKDQFIERGTWISTCPPALPVTRTMAGFIQPGDCPVLDVIPLLKPVRAVSGDVVRLYNGRNAEVNGVTLPNTISKPILTAFPDGEYIVKPGEVWLFSSYSDKSFDSRYFGPVRIDQIHGAARPLLTEDSL